MPQRVFSSKLIAPKRMRQKEVRFEVLNALRKQGVKDRRALRPTVATWKTKPKFDSKISTKGGDLSVHTFPSGDEDAVQRWIWADRGTEPHIIRARNAPYLRFRTGYRSKTLPGRFSSRASRYSGGWRRTRAVFHPGQEARNWTAILLQEHGIEFVQAIEDAIERGIAKTF